MHETKPDRASVCGTMHLSQLPLSLAAASETHRVPIIIMIPGQCLWCCHHAVALREFTLVHAVSAARRQVAADLWTKPIGLNHKPACRLPVNYTHNTR